MYFSVTRNSSSGHGQADTARNEKNHCYPEKQTEIIQPTGFRQDSTRKPNTSFLYNSARTHHECELVGRTGEGGHCCATTGSRYTVLPLLLQFTIIRDRAIPERGLEGTKYAVLHTILLPLLWQHISPKKSIRGGVAIHHHQTQLPPIPTPFHILPPSHNFANSQEVVQHAEDAEPPPPQQKYLIHLLRYERTHIA